MASAEGDGQAQTAAEPAKWFMLDPQGQHQGPYPGATVTGWLASGAVGLETLIWAEGCSSWEPVAQIPELLAQLKVAEAALTALKAAAPNPTAAEQKATEDHLTRQTASTAAPAQPTSAQPQPTAVPPETDGQLAEFQAELAEFDPEAAAAINPTAAAAPQAEPAPSTPPPEDREFEDDDGTAYIWDMKLRKFVEKGSQVPDYDESMMTFEATEETIPAMPQPSVEEAGQELVEQRAQPEASTSEAGPPGGSGQPLRGKQGPGGKRKSGKDVTAADVVAKHEAKAAKDKQEGQQWFDLKQNTSVYVSNLPTDVTEAEIAEYFAKCGIIKEDEERQPRIKIYRDKASGFAKGDGLVTYLKEPSVDLALKILDGSFFRAGDSKPLSVQPAKFEMHGDFVPKKRGNAKKRKKMAQINEEKTLGWGGFDDKFKETEVTVILKHMFAPDELAGNAALAKELEADVSEECVRIGPLIKVKVFSLHPEGIISVKFKTPDAAMQSIKTMAGRFFGGRQVEAHLWDGVTKYGGKPKETAEEQAARLEAFTASIEQGEPPDTTDTAE